MTDEEYKSLVTDHDKSIDVMATSIEHLATAVRSTNGKLEDIISVIGHQNILMEKFSNLEVNLKESFSRVHTKINAIENVQTGKGCAVVREQNIKFNDLTAANKVVNNRIKDLEDETKKILPPALIKWVLGFLITYSIMFGTYVIDGMHTLDSRTESHIATDALTHASHAEKIQLNSNYSNRNYGIIQGHLTNDKGGN